MKRNQPDLQQKLIIAAAKDGTCDLGYLFFTEKAPAIAYIAYPKLLSFNKNAANIEVGTILIGRCVHKSLQPAGAARRGKKGAI